MKNKVTISIIIVLILVNIFQLIWNYLESKPAWNAIPTEEAALEVGKALINSVYGKSIYDDYDYTVIYCEKRDAWYVSKSLQYNNNTLIIVGAASGVLFRRSDGKLLEVTGGM